MLFTKTKWDAEYHNTLRHIMAQAYIACRMAGQADAQSQWFKTLNSF